MAGSTEATQLPVAVVGMACRFPGGVNSPEAFWNLLLNGGCTVGSPPSWRAPLSGGFSPRPGGYLEGIDRFDADFFGISPREATALDPQQRVFLEVAWEALEAAGIPSTRLAGSQTGVFVGLFMHDFENLFANPPDPAMVSAQTAIGLSATMVANRLSYFLDLRGPSLIVDTACSSSLTAVHLACASLASRECRTALVGGVNLLLNPGMSEALDRAAMLAASGRCRPFDAAADGYGRAEGAAALVLKPLEDAVRDGDPVQAVILGTAVGQDGRSPGLTTPSADAQASVADEALRRAGIRAGEVLYVEAHGTGTPVGDPIEADALGSVFGKSRAIGTPCPIGSVKGHIGHTESTAGLAGLMKAVLVARHGIIPPTVNHEHPNPSIPFQSLNIEVLAKSRALPPNARRRISVNSFGFGGSNAHAVIEAWTASPAPEESPDVIPVPLSAKCPEALRELARRHIALADGKKPPSLADVAHTAALGRDHHSHRLCVVAPSLAGYRSRLEAFLSDSPTDVQTGVTTSAPHIAFIFPGAGQLRLPAIRDLWSETVFSDALARWDETLRKLHPKHPPISPELLETHPHDAPLSVSAIVGVQLALVALLESWGITPEAVAGHSLGEIAAYCTAGSLDWKDAATLAIAFEDIHSTLRGSGRMLAVGISNREALELSASLGLDTVIACYDAPAQTTLAGSARDLEILEKHLTLRKQPACFLPIDGAYHTTAAAPRREAFLESLAKLRAAAPRLPVASSVTGALNGDIPNPDYWARNVEQPVRFQQAVEALRNSGVDTFVEISGHSLLSNALRETTGFDPIPTLRRSMQGRRALLDCVARLYCRGANPNWAALQPAPARRISLPSYPWQRQHYWQNPPTVVRRNAADSDAFELLPDGPHCLLARPSPSACAFLLDHIVEGLPIVPAALYCHLAWETASALGRPAALEVIRFLAPVPLSADSTPAFRVKISPDDGNFFIEAEIGDAGWIRAAEGRFGNIPRAASAPCLEIKGSERDKASCYAELGERGLEYGEAFRVLEKFIAGDRTAAAELQIPPRDSNPVRRRVLALDGALQTLALTSSSTDGFLPTGIHDLVLWEDPADTIRVNTESIHGAQTLHITTPDGKIRIQLGRVEFGGRTKRKDGIFYETRWFVDSPTSEVIPSSETLSHEVTPELPRLCGQFQRTDFYERLLPDLEELALAHAAAALASDGIPAEDNASSDTLRLPSGILPQHQAHAHLLLSHLRACLKTRKSRVAENFSPSQGGRAAAISAAGLPCPHQRRLGEKDSQPFGREPERPSGGVACSVTARRGDAPSQAPCHPNLLALARPSLVFKQALRAQRQSTSSPSALFQKILALHPEALSEAVLIDRCGSALRRVWRGETEPLELIFAPGTNTAEHFYESGPTFQIYHRIAASVLSLVVSALPRNRELRILEVGAGTGGLTSHLLPVLPPDRTTYTFTDISPAYAARAAEKFSGVRFLKFRTLDLEKELAPQGFDGESFDVVVAADVLHATRDLPLSLEKLRRLLSPGGLLLLTELTRPPAWIDLVFGMLPGWWLFSDSVRKKHPTLSAPEWESLLTASGFTSVSALADQEPSASLQTVFLATTPATQLPTVPIPTTPTRWRFAGEDFGGFREALNAVELSPNSLPAPKEAVIFFHAPPLETADSCHAAAVACAELASLARRLVENHLENPLWIVTCGACPTGGELPARPFSAALVGFARTLMAEQSRLKIRLVDFPAEPTSKDFAAFSDLSTTTPLEDEIAIRNGRVHYQRILPFTPVRDLPDKIRPSEGEVSLRVLARGLNFNEVAPGGHAGIEAEGAGVVIETAPGVRHLKPGDRVAGLFPRHDHNEFNTPAWPLVRLPANLATEEAAALPIAFLTAFAVLKDLAGLQLGGSVLVHTASGATGLAFLSVAKNLGATVLATAGSPSKRRILELLDAMVVGNSRTGEFAAEALRQTNGKGVDVVVHTLPENLKSASLEALAPDSGRLFDLVNTPAKEHDPREQSFSLAEWSREDPDRTQSLLGHIFSSVAEGRLSPIPFRAIRSEWTDSAISDMRAARHVGKIVLVQEQPVACLPDAGFAIRSDGAYLISGGLTGLGLATARWLAARGAKNLVLLGRRGAATPGAGDALSDLACQGVRVLTPACDVSNETSLRATLDHVRKEMPPLRGIFHAAMILDDGPAVDFDAPRFLLSLEPKARGASLLDLLTRSEPLDCFVCFSSFAAVVGNELQGNYAAANTAMEAVCSARLALGLPASVIQWGAVGGMGTIGENPAIRAIVERQGARPIPLERAFAALEACLGTGRSPAMILDGDWRRFQASSRTVATSPRFLRLLNSESPGSPDSPTGAKLPDDPQQRRAALQTIIPLEIAAVLGRSPDDLPADKPLRELGFDSLMAVELSALLQRRLGFVLPRIALLQAGLTSDTLTAKILESLEDAPSSAPPPPQSVALPVLPAPFDPPADFEARAENIRRLFGENDIYFVPTDGINGPHAVIHGKDFLNFSSYNYLGLSGDAAVSRAAEEAIRRYGTSVSASRLASGERPLHHALEKALADLHQTESALVFTSGYGTNSHVLGHVFGPEDLIVHDEAVHASVLEGIRLAGCRSDFFPHNDVAALAGVLARRCHTAKRALVVVEGIYSMDGDFPDLPAVVKTARAHGAGVLVDEAHSIGVLGATGGGIREHFGMAATDVDLWMGTLSKAFASCGGYIAGSARTVDFLKYTVPGFVFSAGISPPNAAAALEALRILARNPDLPASAREAADLFRRGARSAGFDTGPATAGAVVPIITGSEEAAVALHRRLFEAQILALPMLPPAVPKDRSRLRFFFSAGHQPAEIERTLKVLERSSHA